MNTLNSNTRIPIYTSVKKIVPNVHFSRLRHVDPCMRLVSEWCPRVSWIRPTSSHLSEQNASTCPNNCYSTQPKNLNLHVIELFGKMFLFPEKS